MSEINLEEILDKNIDLYNNAEGRAVDTNTILKAMREACEAVLDMASQYAEVSFEDIRYIEGEVSVDQQSILNLKSRIK